MDEEQADRDLQILQEACLPVSGAPLPPGEPPKDADEYLRQVQWERLHCPQATGPIRCHIIIMTYDIHILIGYILCMKLML